MLDETKQAKKVIDRFKEGLPNEAIKAIDSHHFDELEIMIEAAIDASIVDVVKRSSTIVTGAAKEIQNIAEKPK
ncbi:MAG: hypothetical protein ACE5EH_02090 [Gammaproteobacteria bacterium]